MSVQIENAVRLVGADTRVQLTVDLLDDEGAAEPLLMRWEEFVRDNLEDEALDWTSMAVVLWSGGRWHDGGGAGPAWSLQVAP